METLKEARGSQYGLQTVTRDPSYMKKMCGTTAVKGRGEKEVLAQVTGKKWTL